jgi:hypothetical protein
MRLKPNKLNKESMRQKVHSLKRSTNPDKNGGKRPKLIKSDMKKGT